MISLFLNSEDSYSHYGINHFFEKFGIPVTINTSTQSGVVIAYGCNVSGDFVISIEKNEIENSVRGKISTPSEKIPVCETPHDTGLGEEAHAYFENTTSRYPCVTRKEAGISFGIDIFRETGYLLSGHLDTIRPTLDRSTKQELASKPVVDFLETLLFNAILTGYKEREIPLVRKSTWPGGKKFAVCLTHDIDEIKKTYQWISHPGRCLSQGDFSGFKGQVSSCMQKIKGKEPYYTYDDIIRIEHDLGVKSTYFILKESGSASILSTKTWYLYGRNRSFQSPEIQALVHRLTSNDDEVALHGSYFSYNDPKLLNDEVRELEQLLKEKVLGTRQHNLNLEVPRTWEYQISAGLKYDTSLGFKDTIGFRWGTAFPYFPNTQKEPLPILEIPLSIMDICLKSSKNKIADCLRIADEVERHQGVLTLLWHPPVFNTREYPEFRDIYIKIIQYCHQNGAWIGRARDIYEWISVRNRHTFSCDYTRSAETLTIIPDHPEQEHFFTLHLPAHTQCIIQSGNAKIIRREGDCAYIKTQNLQNNNNITLELNDG